MNNVKNVQYIVEKNLLQLDYGDEKTKGCSFGCHSS